MMEQVYPPSTLEAPRVYTWREVGDRFRDAAQALRAVRITARDRPSNKAVNWPEVVHDVADAYGWEAPEVRRPRPTAEEISAMDEALQWLWWLNNDQRRIVVARGFKISWRRLEDMDGRSERTLRTMHRDALELIAENLTRKKLPPFPEIGKFRT